MHRTSFPTCFTQLFTRCALCTYYAVVVVSKYISQPLCTWAVIKPFAFGVGIMWNKRISRDSSSSSPQPAYVATVQWSVQRPFLTNCAWPGQRRSVGNRNKLRVLCTTFECFNKNAKAACRKTQANGFGLMKSALMNERFTWRHKLPSSCVCVCKKLKKYIYIPYNIQNNQMAAIIKNVNSNLRLESAKANG